MSVMAQQNLLVAHEHLFARKGEAVPAGDSVSGLGQRPFPCIARNGSKKSSKKARNGGKGDSSPLSGLIQRRVYTPEDPVDAENTVGSEHPMLTSWRQLRSRLEAAPHSAPKEEWKKLSFRLRSDQYMRLKKLAGLWGTTYQSILEKAVAYYIDEATTHDDFKWKV